MVAPLDASATFFESPESQQELAELFFEFEEAESGFGEMAGVLVAAVILLIAFGSLIAMGLPIGMALFGLAIGVSSMSLITYLIDIPSWAPGMASMIGLGVGIDYALFLVTRHREHLARGMGVEESVGRAVATAGQAVIFAGGTVMIAILGLAIAAVFGGFIFGNDPTIKMFGVGLATAIFVDASIVRMILVPATMKLMGDANWWLPNWLDRLLPAIDIEGETGLPELDPDVDVDIDLEVPQEQQTADDAEPALV